MNKPSKTIPLLALGAGALALIVALVLAFIPFGTDGSAEPTAAFRAQNDLDEVAFTLGSSAAAKYSGSVTIQVDGGRDPVTVEFQDLIVTTSGNADGTITIDGEQADYLAMNNQHYANASSTAFWEYLLTRNDLENLDLAPTEGAWTAGRYTFLPNLGHALSPGVLAGRIGNSERANPPELGAELPAKKGTPDARFLPTSDPVVTEVEPGKVEAGEWTITFDTESKDVQNVKGSATSAVGTYSYDTTVQLLSVDEASEVFSNSRSLAPELTAVPAPGLTTRGPHAINDTEQVGDCLPNNCAFEVALGAQVSDDTARGRVNYGIDVEFFRDRARTQPVGTPCRNIAVGVPFGQSAKARCVGRDFPRDIDGFYDRAAFRYLSILENDEDSINDSLDDNEEATATAMPMVRTGHKTPEAARYNEFLTGLPSSYAIDFGGYLFDGVAPGNVLMVTFAPGYEAHISDGEFDSGWEGLEILTEQMKQQVEAAGDRQIVYWAAEEETRSALEYLIEDNGYSEDDIRVNQRDAPAE